MWFSLAYALTPPQLSEALAPSIASAKQAEVVRQDFAALAERHGFRTEPDLFDTYVRVVIAFEATREGGWIGNTWAVTNQEPDAQQIFRQYAEGAPAVAECDELSALFSWTARQLGVPNTGLFWPTWNHTVSVWWFEQDGKTHRIVVPTNQVFLDAEQTLGTQSFDPWTQKTIWPYEKREFRGELPKVFTDGLVKGACAAVNGLEANQRRRHQPVECPQR